MPKAFSNQEKEIIRRRLHEKGTQIFETYGLKKTSVDDLTKAVGISKGAFYLFYESKEELFMEILEELERQQRNLILQMKISAQDDPLESLTKLLKAFINSWIEFPLLANLKQADYEYFLRKIPPQRLDTHIHHDQEFMRAFIEKISREGIEVKAPVDQISYLLLSLFFVLLHRNDLGEKGSNESIDILTRLIARYLVEGK